MSDAQSPDEALRDVLLAHSDHRACRNVFQSVTGDGTADLADLVETMRATDGAVAVAARDGAADVYARWTPGGFEHLTIWPPWSIAGLEQVARADLESFLAGTVDARPTPHDETPFASPGTLASMADRIWP